MTTSWNRSEVEDDANRPWPCRSDPWVARARPSVSHHGRTVTAYIQSIPGSERNQSPESYGKPRSFENVRAEQSSSIAIEERRRYALDIAYHQLPARPLVCEVCIGLWCIPYKTPSLVHALAVARVILEHLCSARPFISIAQ